MPRLPLIFKLIIIQSFWINIVIAQWRGLRVDHYGDAQGLGSSINEMVQDSCGYLYLASDDGLIRYDGEQYIYYRHNPADSNSIGPGEVWTIESDGFGNIWIGLRLAGLYSFNPTTQKFRHYPLAESKYARNNSVTAIWEEEEFVWVGCASSELFKLDKKDGTYESYRPGWVNTNPEDKRYRIEEIMQDKFDPNILWICFIDYHSTNPFVFLDAGLVKFNKKTKEFTITDCYGQPKYQDSTGTIWSIAQGVYQYNPENCECKRYPIRYEQYIPGQDVFVTDIIPYQDQFLISSPNALSYFKPDGSYIPVFEGTVYGFLEHIYYDKHKNIWVSRSNGISLIPQQDEDIKYTSIGKLKGNLYPARLTYHEEMNAAFVVDHSFDGTGCKIYKVSLESGIQECIYHSNQAITGIFIDPSRTMWYVSGGMIYSFNLKGNPIQSLKAYPSNIKIENLWNLQSGIDGIVGGVGNNSFFWFTPSMDSIAVHEVKIPSTFEKGVDSRLQGGFFSTDSTGLVFSNRVYEIKLKSEELTELKIDPKIMVFPSMEILSVVLDQEGFYWVSNLTITAKFKRVRDSLVLVKKFIPEDGFTNIFSTEMFCDQSNRIWMFSPNGLYCYDQKEERCLKFGIERGLEKLFLDPRQILSTIDGRVITVNGSGIILFQPGVLAGKTISRSFPLAIQDIRISGKRHFSEDPNFIQQIYLSPHDEYLDISYRALTYPHESKVQYSYFVENLQEGWTKVGNNKLITLAALNPGTYKLHIRAGDHHDEKFYKTITVIKKSPFYKMPAFLFFVSLAMLSIISFITRYRIKKAKKVAAERIANNRQLMELELKAVRSQLNPHFLFNSLNSVKSYLLKSSPQAAAEHLSRFAHLLRLILENSKEKLISLESELETLKLYIELEQERFDYSFDYEIIIDEHIDISEQMLPPLLIQPYVENAIWHGLLNKIQKGKLLIHINSCNNEVVIIVEDNGIGRQEAMAIRSRQKIKYKSIGMGITKDRIELMNKINSIGIRAEIEDVFNKEGRIAGTRVRITIPEDILLADH